MKDISKQVIFLLVLIVLSSTAFAERLTALYDITHNDIVTEHITAGFESEREYDYFTFETIRMPISVQYDGEYSIVKAGDRYEIIFTKEIAIGMNSISFTLLYDDMIERSGSRKIFRNSLSTDLAELDISVRLPTGYSVSGSPGAVPRPKEITTDGERITLHWSFSGNADLSVFYSGGFDILKAFAYSGLFLAVFIVVIIIAGKRKIRSAVTDTLSEDQKKIIDLVSSGIDKQQDIAKKLGFSKSKISKVLRSLEEKGLVVKEAHFKTNKIKLKGI